MDQIDHLLEQLEPERIGRFSVGRPEAATHHDTLPWPFAQCSTDDLRDVVTAIEAEQAGFDTDTVLDELGDAPLDLNNLRLGVPGPGDHDTDRAR